MVLVTNDVAIVTSSMLVFVVVFGVAYLFTIRHKKYGNRNLPPSLPSLPLIGSIPFLVGYENFCDCFLKISKRLGPVFSFYAGTRYVVVLNGHRALNEAMLSRGADFADRWSFYTELATNPNKKGIGFRQFQDGFKEEKQLILKIFRQLGIGTRIMETRIQHEVGEFIKYVRETVGDKAFDPVDVLMPLVTNVILSILYGHRFDIHDPRLKRLIVDSDYFYQNTVPELDVFVILRYLPSYRRRTRLAREAINRNVAFSKDCMLDCLQDETETDSFVRRYAQKKGANFNADDFKFILRDLTMAGLDTSSLTVLWCIVLLANHRSVQDSLHAEIDSVVGKDRLPSLHDRERLPYTEATILETMRYKTVAPIGILHATLCDTHVNGFFVPKDTTVVPNIYSCHMDEDVWEQPEQFRPERFLDDTGNLTSLKDKIVAFGLGKRSCMGEQLGRQNIFLFFVGILQQFDILPPEGCDRVEYHDRFDFVLGPSAYQVRMIARQ